MLTDLVAGALQDAAERRAALSQAHVEAAALSRAPAIDALLALKPVDRVRIIAEIKRSSPSKGMLADIPDPAALARLYQDGGASAISVLTEGRRFGGSLQDLEAVRAAVNIPVLRKDFIADPYQVFEARAAGADLVLLMAAVLDQASLTELYGLVTQLGMTALVETHDAEELERAIDIGARLIGVNARNLSTFELNPDLFGTLVDRIPAGVITVAESAVRSAADVARYRSAGADIVLVGEALVRESLVGGDPVAMLTEFLAV